MNRLILTLLALSGTASATVPADCTAILLGSSSGVIYRSKATFPDVPQSISLSFLDRTEPDPPAALCGFTFAPDVKARVLRVSTAQLKGFSKLYREGYADTGRIGLENQYFSGLDGTAVSVVLDPRTYRLDVDLQGHVGDPLTIGVKIDGGALKALYYRSTTQRLQVPRNAKTIDIYVKAAADYRLFWQRAVVDLVKPTIAFYETSPFPVR